MLLIRFFTGQPLVYYVVNWPNTHGLLVPGYDDLFRRSIWSSSASTGYKPTFPDEASLTTGKYFSAMPGRTELF